ncbi:MAG: hypothetical protein ACYDH1_00780 [Anaerolineaceae bacterium]
MPSKVSPNFTSWDRGVDVGDGRGVEESAVVGNKVLVGDGVLVGFKVAVDRTGVFTLSGI